MKHIFLAAVILIFLITSSAYGQNCNIYIWDDDGSLRGSPISTSETSKTIISTEQAAYFLNNESALDGCDDQCCYDDDGIDGGFYFIVAYVGACIDGTWEHEAATCAPSCVHEINDSGTWDVICDDIDLDGVDQDGDNSGIVGDSPCTGGNTLNCDDNCRLTANSDQSDIDADGIGDVCDNCPENWNPGQWDGNGDGNGDACGSDPDTDGDGVADIYDNCPALANPFQQDADNDGSGNVCDPVFSGSYTIENNTDLDALSGITEVTGDLTIKGKFLTILSVLESLSSVGGSLTLQDNTHLINLNGLSNITNIGGSLSFFDNHAMTSLTGLENLTSVGGALTIRDNFNLINLNGLSNITNIGGSLSIYNNDDLTSLSALSNLTSVYWLNVKYNKVLASLTGLEALTSIGGLDIKSNAALTSLSALSNITSTSIDSLLISVNPALTSLDGLSNITSVSGELRISYNDALTNLTALSSLISVGGELHITSNDTLISLSGLYNVYLNGGFLGIYSNLSLCMETAQALEDRLRSNGFSGTSTISSNNGTVCPPEIYDVMSNHGSGGEYIPLEYLQNFSLPSQRLQWIAEDPDAAPETGIEWEWTLGIAYSYVSYWTEGMTSYSPETELILNDDTTGYYGRWKWVSPVSYLPGDGWYWVKLISEDVDGNRSESAHSVIVNTSIADSDNDGIPDSSDNCPDTCNSQQLDADGDNIGDVCDETSGCGGCGQDSCEQEC